MNQAIEEQSFHEHNVPVVKKGDTSLQFENSVTVTGTATSNPQTHWYLEPLCSVAEIVDDRLDMQLTTQFQSHVHEQIAFVLNMNASNIKISTKRVGGGFGGKGRPSDIVAIAAAIGAKISGRRVVMEIPLRHSHQINGGRPEARGDYRAIFDKESNLLKSLHIDLYVDCGYSCNDGKVYNFCMNTLRALGQEMVLI